VKRVNRLLLDRVPELVGIAFIFVLIAIGHQTIVKQNVKKLKEPMRIPVLLRTASALKIGAKVTVLGVDSGVVSSLHYIPVDASGRSLDESDDPPAGQVVIAILDLVEEIEFYNNYSIVTRNSHILSARAVEIHPGTLQPGEIPLKPVKFSLEETLAFQKSPAIPQKKDVLLFAGNAEDPVYLVAKVISENKDNIRIVLKNLGDITEKINHGNGTIALLLNDGTIYRQSDSVMKEGIALTADGREGAEDLREARTQIEFLSTYFIPILKVLLTGGL